MSGSNKGFFGPCVPVVTCLAQTPGLMNYLLRLMQSSLRFRLPCSKKSNVDKTRKFFSNLHRKSLPADVQDDCSSTGSPGEFRDNVQKFLEHMVQSFEMQAIILRIEQLQIAFSSFKHKGRRPAFKRSLQFSSGAISVD